MSPIPPVVAPLATRLYRVRSVQHVRPVYVACSLLGIQCVANVVRHGRLRWFGHLERKSENDWVSSCRYTEVAGVKCVGRDRKTWGECVRDDMKLLGLQPEWAVFRDMWRDLIWSKSFCQHHSEKKRMTNLKLNNSKHSHRYH